MDKLNKDGLTEKQFLESYDNSMFTKPSLTVDSILFSIKDEKLVVLLIQRGNFPDMGSWAFPGGFMEENETCENTAMRELEEETGIVGVELEQMYTVSTPNRDPRGWTVTNCFLGVIEEPLEAKGADDAVDAKWFTADYAAKDDHYELVLRAGDIVLRAVMKIVRSANGKIDINKSTIIANEGLAFDHAKLLLYAIETL